VPPIPISRSTPVPGRAAAIAGAVERGLRPRHVVRAREGPPVGAHPGEALVRVVLGARGEEVVADLGPARDQVAGQHEVLA
jgi:hypothetical protein